MRVWSSDEILDAIRAWAGKYGSPPTAYSWKASHETHPANMTVIRRFGSWNAAIQAAGYPAARKGWTVEQFKQAVFLHVYEHGKPPTAIEWALAAHDRSRPTSKIAQGLFGSWSEAMRQAGYGERDRAQSARARRRSAAGTFV